MLKVIVADDEERVCRLIRMIVDWESLDMEVIGTASNGIEALELVESLRPDILITDIRMPGCDGLELIEKAKAILPYLQIALISGYAQFEYAQTAINIGVGGYILKPIKKEIITATLKKLGKTCRERVEQASTSERLLQDSHKNSELLRGRLLEDLLSHRLQEPSRDLLEKNYGFMAEGGMLQVFIIKMDCDFKRFHDPSTGFIKKKTEDIFDTTVAPLCQLNIFQMHLSSWYGILNYKNDEQAKIRRALRECLNQLEAHHFGGVEFSLAIGKAANCAEDLPASLQDAQIAIAERLTERTGRLLETGKSELHHDSKKLTEKYIKTMERVADMLSNEEADEALEEMIDEIQSVGLRGYELFSLVMSVGRKFAMHLNLDEDAAIINEFDEQCELCGSAGKLLDYLRSFITEQINNARNRLESASIRPIRIARQFITQHFNEPITLEDICAATGFSMSYFSKLFKKETGEGFSKYLVRVRIDRAKELLRDTDTPVSEICGLVGYSDIKHFTGTFKKMTNLNPGQYRKLYG
ncbi:MAG: response regulator [Oscillospiraceae bacterium]|nr:response regulator [Oscillospiraceae bacterium]